MNRKLSLSNPGFLALIIFGVMSGAQSQPVFAATACIEIFFNAYVKGPVTEGMVVYFEIEANGEPSFDDTVPIDPVTKFAQTFRCIKGGKATVTATVAEYDDEGELDTETHADGADEGSLEIRNGQGFINTYPKVAL